MGKRETASGTKCFTKKKLEIAKLFFISMGDIFVALLHCEHRNRDVA
jgi:hypothetical protein